MNHYLAAVVGGFGVMALAMVYLARAWTGPSTALRPTGRHRGRPQEQTVPLGVLMQPEESREFFEDTCPAEDQPTLHIRLRLGGELCCRCGGRDLTQAGGAR